MRTIEMNIEGAEELVDAQELQKAVGYLAMWGADTRKDTLVRIYNDRTGMIAYYYRPAKSWETERVFNIGGTMMKLSYQIGAVVTDRKFSFHS